MTNPISLAQWSLHRMHRSGELDPLDFPAFTRERFGIDAVEYVNTFFKDKATNIAWLNELNTRCADAGVTSLVIMVDREGDTGHPDADERARAIENHHKWIDAAALLGCHSIRVNAASKGTELQQHELVVDGLSRLVEYAAPRGINVLVENHGGLSSNAAWLASVIAAVDHPNCGTLPDFGNFCFDWSRRDEPDMWYDRYQGVDELMPFARAVSAKSNDFDADGFEQHTDYARMMSIVHEHGYDGYIGIEYEGDVLSEVQGIAVTKVLLERVASRAVTA